MLTHWVDATREELVALAPHTLAVLPVGAIEQHGPHLPTDTDTAIVTAVSARACELAGADVDVVLLPTLAFGASDHHLPFGGTLSLRTTTMAAVLADLLRSLGSSGFRRALMVNGHGGNVGLCAEAVRQAASETGMRAAAVSYWQLLEPEPGVPGHAGAFETSALLHLSPERVRTELARPSPGTVPSPPHPAVALEDPQLWRRIDGFTDDPRAATADRGARALDAAASALAAVIRELPR